MGSSKEILEKQDDIASLKQRESTLKELAANSEVQLSEFNASYDLYKADAQRTISKLEDESKKYKEKTDLLNEEIKTLDETLANTENILNTERGNHDKEINTLKSRIKDLEKSEEKVR